MHTPLSYDLSHATVLCVGTTCVRISARGSAVTFPALALKEDAIGICNQKPTLIIGMLSSWRGYELFTRPVAVPREP
jgi:hypothetical protein